MRHQSQRYLYRSRNGVILGVIRGLGDYTGLDVFWLRVAAVATLVFTGFIPMVPVYFLAALLMKPEPMDRPLDSDTEEFYNAYATNRLAALQRLKKRMDGLDRRTRRMEGIVTNREYDWDRRMGEV